MYQETFDLTFQGDHVSFYDSTQISHMSEVRTISSMIYIEKHRILFWYLHKFSFCDGGLFIRNGEVKMVFLLCKNSAQLHMHHLIPKFTVSRKINDSRFTALKCINKNNLQTI